MAGPHDPAGAAARAIIRDAGPGATGPQEDDLKRRENRSQPVSANAPQPEGPDFRQLFEGYYRSVRYFFANRGFSTDEAQDLAQETFLRAFKGFEAFRGDASFRTWIFQIANNIWLNEVRCRHAAKRSGNEVSFEEAFRPGSPHSRRLGISNDGPLGEVLAEERLQVLRDAVKDLPPQMRRCIFLRIEQDLKYREIAELMQLSIETVKSHLHQARQRLKGILSEYFDDGDPL